MSMEMKIKEKLEKIYQPKFLMVVNQSHLHKGHMGDDGSGESHFLIEIESDFFESLSRLDSQRSIHQTLDEEMKKIHALSLKIKKQP